MYGLSPVWVLRWSSLVAFDANDFPQMSHVKFFSFACTSFRCLERPPESRNCFPHTWQVNGPFVPVNPHVPQKRVLQLKTLSALYALISFWSVAGSFVLSVLARLFRVSYIADTKPPRSFFHHRLSHPQRLSVWSFHFLRRSICTIGKPLLYRSYR